MLHLKGLEKRPVLLLRHHRRCGLVIGLSDGPLSTLDFTVSSKSTIDWTVELGEDEAMVRQAPFDSVVEK